MKRKAGKSNRYDTKDKRSDRRHHHDQLLRREQMLSSVNTAIDLPTSILVRKGGIRGMLEVLQRDENDQPLWVGVPLSELKYWMLSTALIHGKSRLAFVNTTVRDQPSNSMESINGNQVDRINMASSAWKLETMLAQVRQES